VLVSQKVRDSQRFMLILGMNTKQSCFGMFREHFVQRKLNVHSGRNRKGAAGGDQILQRSLSEVSF
jgi:hypothetical protein